MPKKKTGQRKKAEKQKLRQKEIRSRAVPLADVPCNAAMEVNITYQKKQQQQQQKTPNLHSFPFSFFRFASVISANGSKNPVHFAIFAKVFNVYRFVPSVVK